ncbi:hypothetical protein D3C77_322990 [compost metagenome]
MLFGHLPALLLSRLNGRGYTLKKRLLLQRHVFQLLGKTLLTRLFAMFRLLPMACHLLTEVTQQLTDCDFQCLLLSRSGLSYSVDLLLAGLP